jgi:hypothetical protein
LSDCYAADVVVITTSGDTHGRGARKLSDETVLQRAMADVEETTARIEELRAQIAEHEDHIAEVDRFIATYRRYASEGAADIPVPAFAYAE